GHDRAVVEELDAVLEAHLPRCGRVLVLDPDLARLAGVVRMDGLQVRERLLRAGLDQLTRACRYEHPRARLADARLDSDRRQAVAEKLLAFPAGRLVAGDDQDRATPCSPERRVCPRLADPRVVEPEVLPRLARNSVVEDAVGSACHRVHADEERRVATFLEKAGVLRPLFLDDVLARGIELLGEQRVERVALAGAVAVHDDDLGRPGRLRAADRGVDLPGVELAPLLEHESARIRLVALHDPADALHVADDVNAHWEEPNRKSLERGIVPRMRGVPRTRDGRTYGSRSSPSKARSRSRSSFGTGHAFRSSRS